MKSLENTTIEHFKSHFQGDVVLPTDFNYDEVRQIWNGMIDRKPSLIARCKSTDDVVMAVNFARDNGLLLTMVCYFLYEVGDTILRATLSVIMGS